MHVRKFWMNRREERGAMLVLSVVSLVVVVVSAAIAIDLGRLAHEKRSDQRVADLAALDAARGLEQSPDPLVRARQSADRNGFKYNTYGWTMEGNDLNVCQGLWNAALQSFVPNGAGLLCSVPPVALPGTVKAVRVKVVSGFKTAFPFVAGPRSAAASAIATQQGLVLPPPTTTTTPPPTAPPNSPKAGFTIGSSLLNLNSSSSTLLNPIIGGWLGSSVNLSLASWQGLANGNVTLAQLQTALAGLGFNVGSVDQLLAANLTLADLIKATGNALRAGGDTANANILFPLTGTGLAASATSKATFKLSDILTIEQGSQNAALGSYLNAFQLVTASAEAANGDHAVQLSNVGITVPGVTQTALSVAVIDPPKWYYGVAGGSVTTGQVAVVVTPRLNLDVTVGLTALKVTNDLPVGLEAGSATGTLKTISCSNGSGTGITVTADPKAFSGAARSTVLRVSTLLNIPVLDVQTTSATAAVDGPPVDVNFTYPGEFKPPSANPTTKHIGSQPVGLQQRTTFTSGNVTVLGVLPLGTTTGQIVSAVMAALNPLIGNVDNNILTPLLTALGLDIGGADVTAVGPIQDCALPPASTTTTAPTTTTTTIPTYPPPSLVR